MRRNDTVQSLQRALRVIERLSQQPAVSLAQLHVSTGLPKPTLFRLLGTLIEEGYARRISHAEGYALTSKVLRFSAAIRRSDVLVEAAWPLMEAFTHEHQWPISLATREGYSMRVRASTQGISPHGIGRDHLNRQFGILWSAMGWAYIAYCPHDESEVIRALTRSSGAPSAKSAAALARVNAKIEETRRNRYASVRLVRGDVYRRLAIPILAPETSDEVLGVLHLRWFPKVMTTEQAASRYLARLRALADQIGRAVRDGSLQGDPATSAVSDRRIGALSVRPTPVAEPSRHGKQDEQHPTPRKTATDGMVGTGS